MLKIKNTILLVFLIGFYINSNAQNNRILLDGSFDDWSDKPDHFEDPSGDGRFGFDFENLIMDNDEQFLFLSFDIGIEINLQDQNEVVLYLDTDDDPQTGYVYDGIGAEIIYFFGDRSGYFYKNNTQKSIEHRHLGLSTLPTVSSNRFEICMDRNILINNDLVFPGNTVRAILLHDVQNGDKLPDGPGGVKFKFSDDPLTEMPKYTLAGSNSSDFRFLSYNVLFDELFDKQAQFRRQIAAIDPDIIAFQEIYDHSAEQTKDLVEDFLGGSWYAAKQGSDIIMISKYPILESHYIKGNGGFLIDVNGQQILVINAHLPCCSNDSGRQEEVDAIMAFIRKSKNGETSLNLQENTPIIIAGDMNFVGKNRQIRTFIEGDINNEAVYGADFAPDWDGSDFKDILSFATNTPLALTWYDLESSYNPGRLDYIIYSDAVLQVKNAFNLFSQFLPVDSLQHYGILKDDTKNASDHIPVVADFVFGSTSAVQALQSEVDKMVDVYPNPFSKTVRIRLKKDIKGVIPIQILDQTGKLVLENMIDADLSPEIILQTETMAPGLYYLMFEINGRKYPVQLSKI
jgi:exonuclease III